jgi:hypothetical protein
VLCDHGAPSRRGNRSTKKVPNRPRLVVSVLLDMCISNQLADSNMAFSCHLSRETMLRYVTLRKQEGIRQEKAVTHPAYGIIPFGL